MHISLNSGCKLLFYVEKDYFFFQYIKEYTTFIADF